MSERQESPFPPGTSGGPDESLRAWTDRILLVVAAVALAFFAWNLFAHGMAARDDHAFQTGTKGLFLLLCIILAFSLFLDARSAWQEGLKRLELPPVQVSPSFRERSFRITGPTQPLFRHCAGELDKRFRRFYAFHRYQAPYVAYFYYARKGSLSLLGLPWMKTGFLLLFLTCYTYVARLEICELQRWELIILGAGCLFVIAGLLIRLAVPYRKIWLRIVEENSRSCLTVSCVGPSRGRWFTAFCESLETQSGDVSCSTHSR